MRRRAGGVADAAGGTQRQQASGLLAVPGGTQKEDDGAAEDQFEGSEVLLQQLPQGILEAF